MSIKHRKAFTITELVIVIAVVAILAAILIPTFSNVLNSANRSADEQAVTQMNSILNAEHILNGELNVEEAKKILSESGFNVDSYIPLNKNHIFYFDETECKILIYDQSAGKVIYPSEIVDKYSNYSDGQKSMNWYILNEHTFEIVSIEDLGTNSLYDAIKASTSYQTIKLEKDWTLSSSQLMGDLAEITRPDGSKFNVFAFPLNEDKSINLDLNGHTLNITVGSTINVNIDSSVRISNGKITTVSDLGVLDYGSLTLENVEMSSTESGGVFVAGIDSEVNIVNSSIQSPNYGITTNASGFDSWNVIVNVTNSTVKSVGGYPGVLVNVPGFYTFVDSDITGDGIGAAIRGGTATFENCTITETGDNTWAVDYLGNAEFSCTTRVEGQFAKGIWGSGNMVQFGGLILGDWSNAYNYDTHCTIKNTRIIVQDKVAFPTVYLSQDGSCSTTFDYDEQSSFGNYTINGADGVLAGLSKGKITVNGEAK